MAARYWVGGAGNWSSTTKWSTSSGGASGASVPTSADDVIFDANSGGKFVATVDTTQSVNSITITPSSAVGVLTISLSAQLTTGSLTTTGTAGNNRVFFTSTTYGIAINFVVNGAVSISDCDFRGIYVTGTASPISGTRIGNRGECRGITFSTPKTVYWRGISGNWSSSLGWSNTSGGVSNTDYFPLPQDTATIDNAGSAGNILTLDSAIGYLPTIDMLSRTNFLPFSVANATTVYGSWQNGLGTFISGTATLTFSGGGTQTITSAGVAFTCPITINTYGGTVQLADALNIGTNILTVTNGTFNTQGYAVTAGSLFSSNSNVRTITLGASTLSLSSGVTLTTTTNLTFNAGTSQINIASTGTTFPGGLTFYNVSFTNTASVIHSITGANTFNNLTFTAPASSGVVGCTFSANQTINGTLTCAGASAVRRIFLQSDTIGTQRDLTVGTLSANDCDFRDVEILGTASGTAPTRAGDCGNNAGITFPSPKTVYWNLAGAQNWSATGWATSSGGSPAVNNFPLAQDTAVFDNTGSVTGTITINTRWNIGTFDASARTSAMTLTTSTNSPVVYGDWKFGTGVTSSSTTGNITFSKKGTSTITSNGVQFGCTVTINHPSGTVQLADALSLNSVRTLTVNNGIFDAVTYNVTTGKFTSGSSGNIKMGSGTWTLSGTGTVWDCFTGPTLIPGTSTILLSDTSTTARFFDGGGLYYNKLTIGGATGTSTLTVAGANTFGELASTKTVAHTITLPSGVNTTVGKWSVTGTVGNVVTLTPSTAASVYTLIIAGPANTGIDYLSISYCTVSTTSPGEFYAGANSTNTAGNTRVIFTATPSPRTLYWVGGTGNWSATTSWSTSSGGGSGAAIPTSLDAVNFDSLSNATAYTVTIDAGVTIARCASFTMGNPALGTVTFAGTAPIAYHGSVLFPASYTRTFTGTSYCAGNTSGLTLSTSNVQFVTNFEFVGIGASWSLTSGLFTSIAFVLVTYGSFSSAGQSVQAYGFSSNNSNVRSISLGTSTLTFTLNNSWVVTPNNLTFSAGTSTIICSYIAPTFAGAGLSYNTVRFTSTSGTSGTITGANTFNTLSFAGQTTVGINAVTFSANQTISTLTLNAGTAAAYRTLLASNTIGTQRTLSVGTLTAGAADYDFRDIAITGAASPIAPTRAGDCKGNSGITFPAAKTVYFRANSGTWGASGSGSWALTNGGSLDATAFPLAQDTAIFPSAYPASGSTVSISSNYNIGTIDMSARTANTMTLATGTTTPTIYGNWINGTGTTLTGTNNMTFAGRGMQTITSAGKAFPLAPIINTPGGSVTLQDAFTATTGNTFLTAGTFDANVYNVIAVSMVSSNSNIRTIAVGSGTWSLTGGSPWNASTSTNLTVTGTGTISLISPSAKTFTGGGISYSGITLNQGGAGTLTVSGNNTLKDITNTYSATGAATIDLAATTTTLTQFTGTGAAAKLLTLSGTSAASPATLILTSGVVSTPDYLSISNVRAYSLSSTWYAGANSTNLGSLGWIFASAGGTVYSVTITETGTGTDAITAKVTLLGSISETGTGTDSISGGLQYLGAIDEFGTGTDSIAAKFTPLASITETATGSDVESAILAAISRINETATGSDTESAKLTAKSNVAETATGTDTDSARMTARSSISELATITDLPSAKVQFLTAIAESATASDLISAIKGLFAYIVESASGTDAINAPGSTYNPRTVETATATDSITALARFASQVVESATISDLISATKTLLSAILESAVVTDTPSAKATFRSQVAETAAAQDIVRGFMVAAVRITETATGSDQIRALRALAAVVVETLTLYEGLLVPTNFNTPGAGAWTVPAGVTTAIVELWGGGGGGGEGTSSGDGNGGGGGAYAKKTIGVTPGASLSFTVGSGGAGQSSFPFPVSPASPGTASVYSTVTAGGGLGAGAGGTAYGGDINISGNAGVVTAGGTAGGPGGGASDTAPGGGGSGGVYSGGFFNNPGNSGLSGRVRFSYPTGTPTASVIFRGILQEIATLTDAVTAPGSTYRAPVVELAVLQDLVRAAATFPTSITETATGTQTNSATFIPYARITESATITDAATAVARFAAEMTETATIVDQSRVAPSVFNAITVATATALGSFSPAGSIYNAPVIETAVGLDSLIGAYLWNIIDDSQTPSWGNTNNQQTVVWVQVNDTQAPSWQNINNAQTPGWGAIDDSQDPDWTPVLP